MINISYLNVPLFDEETLCKTRVSKSGIKLNKEEFNILKEEIKKDNLNKLSEKMFITAQPLYKNIEIKFNQLHRMVSSDYRQYSPFIFENNTKKSENWNNSKQNILILDVDDGMSIVDAKNLFKEYQYFICTTKSHQKEKKGKVCDRFRVILKAINIPVGDTYFEYMRQLELLFPFVDKQVNTKTGAFLGFANCEYWYNKGKDFDFEILKPTQKKQVPIKQQIKPLEQKENDLPIETIKTYLNQDMVAQIVESLGYSVDRNYKFKYRLDEKTPSASISNSDNPLIKDFGSDLSTDAFGFVEIVSQCTFKDAVRYVGNFVGVDILENNKDNEYFNNLF